jgi:hypothetical protein
MIELTHGYRNRSQSKERSISVSSSVSSLIQERMSTDQYRLNSPSSIQPVLNRVKENTPKTDTSQTCSSQKSIKPLSNKHKLNPRPRSPPPPPPPVLPLPKSFPSSIPRRSSNPPAVSFDEDISLANSMLFVLPVQYTSSPHQPPQHGVTILPSSLTLNELAKRLQDQFVIQNDFDIVLVTSSSERREEVTAAPATVQVP